MGTAVTHNEDIQKIGEMIKQIGVAMLTTIEPDGRLRSRPMATQQVEFDGDLWFFTKATAPKVDEIQHHQRVNVSLADPERQRYVSISGTAELVRDPLRIVELWSPHYRAWFPEGPDDPLLALLRVRVEQAEYWEAPNGTVGKLASYVLSLAAGRPVDLAENRKLDLSLS